MFTKLFIFAYCRAYAGSPHDVQSGFWSKTTVENHYLTIMCLVWWTVFKNYQIFVLVKPLKICWNEVTERRNFSFIIHLIFHLLWNNSLPLLFDLFPNPLMCCAILFIKMKCKHTIILEDTLSSLHTNTHTHRHIHISCQKLPIRQMPAAAHTHTTRKVSKLKFFPLSPTYFTNTNPSQSFKQRNTFLFQTVCPLTPDSLYFFILFHSLFFILPHIFPPVHC